jgi:hypothetical protein
VITFFGRCVAGGIDDRPCPCISKHLSVQPPRYAVQGIEQLRQETNGYMLLCGIVTLDQVLNVVLAAQEDG